MTTAVTAARGWDLVFHPVGQSQSQYTNPLYIGKGVGEWNPCLFIAPGKSGGMRIEFPAPREMTNLPMNTSLENPAYCREGNLAPVVTA